MYQNKNINLPLNELVTPLTSGEKSSDIISQGIGPKPNENAAINKHIQANGKKLIAAASFGSF